MGGFSPLDVTFPFSPLKWLVLFTLIGSTLCNRYAYVTIHYEGTQRDDEYVVGVRTLIRSIKISGTNHDIIVLCSDTVRQQSKDLFLAEGAKVQMVQNIANPYKEDPSRRKYYQPRFDGTLNKIHLWNMTGYDRVLYLDADSVVIHNTDELFLCGHFCAAFMNTLAFHTAVMVVRPNATAFKTLVASLANVESYDGADQGFFVSYFKELGNAPYFDVTKGESNAPLNRLYLGYSMNHIYFYEKSSWDHGYRTLQFKDLKIPAFIMTYPIAPNAKPWYWWTYIIFELNWLWDSYRVRLGDPWERVVIDMILILSIFMGLTEFGIRKYTTKKFKLKKVLFFPVTVIWFFVSLYISFKAVPPLMIPTLALPFFALLHNVLFFYFLRIIAIIVGWKEQGNLSVMKAIAMGLFLYFAIYSTTSHSYSNPVFKIWAALTPLLMVATHTALARYFVWHQPTNKLLDD